MTEPITAAAVRERIKELADAAETLRLSGLAQRLRFQPSDFDQFERDMAMLTDYASILDAFETGKGVTLGHLPNLLWLRAQQAIV